MFTQSSESTSEIVTSLDGVYIPGRDSSPVEDSDSDDADAPLRDTQTILTPTMNPTNLLTPSAVPVIAQAEPGELQSPPTETLTNRERLELILELNRQLLHNGDVWFIIPYLWFQGWKKLCEDKPDEVGTTYRPINVSAIVSSSGGIDETPTVLVGNRYISNCIQIPLGAWNSLSHWWVVFE